MDWIGIGVLIIGVAFSALVIVLIKPLRKLTDVLKGVEQTTERLPKVLDDSATQAHEVFQNVNATLVNVNEQVQSVNPVLHIVKDAGEASQQLTAVALEKTLELKKNTTEAKEFTDRKRYQGFYGIVSFFFYLFQNKKDLKESLPKVNAK